MVDPSLQHGAAAYPLILKKEIQVHSVRGGLLGRNSSNDSLAVGTLVFIKHILFEYCLYILIQMLLI
jgi:hypothetical protein